MNEKVLKTLEYNKIIERLSAHASSPGGKLLCEKLTPMTNIEQINEELKKTEDALSRIYQKGSVSFSGVYEKSTFCRVTFPDTSQSVTAFSGSGACGSSAISSNILAAQARAF